MVCFFFGFYFQHGLRISQIVICLFFKKKIKIKIIAAVGARLEFRLILPFVRRRGLDWNAALGLWCRRWRDLWSGIVWAHSCVMLASL